MGEVYRARDTRLDRTVAIKALPEDVARDAIALAGFRREILRASRISHARVAHVYDVVEHDGHPLLVMEHVEGRPLSRRMAAGPVPLDEARRIIIEIAEALAAAHRAGVLHRDVKPSNVLIDGDGHVKLVDFGVAAHLPATREPSRDDSTLSDSGPSFSPAGTITYMSPEQLRGRTLDARSDLFSLGILAHELLTGSHPFRREARIETVSAILDDEPEPLPKDLVRRAPWARACRALLAKDPAERPATAEELIAALEEPSQRRSTHRWRAVAWLAGALVASALLVAVLDGNADSPAALDDGSAKLGEAHARERLERARELSETLRYDAAARILDALITEHPEALEPRALRVRVAVLSGRLRRARDEADAMLAVARERRGILDEPRGLLLRVVAAEARERYAEALRLAEAAARGAPGDARVWRVLARARQRRGDGSGALAAIRQARELAPDDPQLALVEIESLAEAGEHEAALERAHALRSRLVGLERPRLVARLDEIRGGVLADLQRLDEAAQSFGAARSAYEASGLEALAARASVSIADLALLRGAPDEAAVLYPPALATLREAGSYGLVVETLTGIGAQRYVSGDLVGAAKHLERALDEARKLERDDLRAQAALQLAYVRLDEERYDEAERLARHAIELPEGARGGSGAFSAATILASVARARGELTEAAATLRDLVDARRGRTSEREELAYAAFSLAEVELARERFADALAAVEEAIRSDDARGARLDLAFDLALAARIAAHLGDGETAETTLARATKLGGDGVPAFEKARATAAVALALVRGETPDESLLEAAGRDGLLDACRIAPLATGSWPAPARDPSDSAVAAVTGLCRAERLGALRTEASLAVDAARAADLPWTLAKALGLLASLEADENAAGELAEQARARRDAVIAPLTAAQRRNFLQRPDASRLESRLSAASGATPAGGPR